MQTRERITELMRRWLAALMLPLCTLALAAGQQSPQQALESALAGWVAAQHGLQAEQVSIAPLDPRVQIQPCASSFSFDYPFVNHENVRARCGKPAWQIFVKVGFTQTQNQDRKSTRLNSSHVSESRMPSSA